VLLLKIELPLFKIVVLFFAFAVHLFPAVLSLPFKDNLMQTRKAFYLLLFLTCHILKLSAQAVNEKDSLALVDLYNNTGGPNWNVHSNWLTGPVSSWKGISLVGDRVTAIRLTDNNLTGYIPGSLGNMNQLSLLLLFNNQLAGHIPSTFGNLKNLQQLNLGNNKLTGNIPASFGKLINLTHLFLDSNHLEGHIPYEISNLKNVQQLLLNQNNFSGDVSMLGRLPLIRLNLSYNSFTFDGIELVASLFQGAIFIYRKQSLISVHQNGNILSVSAGGTLENNKYVWLTADNSDSTVITGDSVFHPKKSGTYRVRVINSTAKRLKLRSIVVNYTAPADSIPKYDKPKTFVAYPNPVKNILNIQNAGNATFTLMDQTGRVVLKKDITDNGAMDASNLQIGIYYLRNSNTGALKKVMKLDYQ
jgi:Secretion system C-terminal sorting domain/Leucine rich repeat